MFGINYLRTETSEQSIADFFNCGLRAEISFTAIILVVGFIELFLSISYYSLYQNKVRIHDGHDFVIVSKLAMRVSFSHYAHYAFIISYIPIYASY